MSASANSDADLSAFAFPTETEVYIRPDGRVIIADLPAELAALVAELGDPQACAITARVQENPEDKEK